MIRMTSLQVVGDRLPTCAIVDYSPITDHTHRSIDRGAAVAGANAVLLSQSTWVVGRPTIEATQSRGWINKHETMRRVSAAGARYASWLSHVSAAVNRCRTAQQRLTDLTTAVVGRLKPTDINASRSVQTYCLSYSCRTTSIWSLSDAVSLVHFDGRNCRAAVTSGRLILIVLIDDGGMEKRHFRRRTAWGFASNLSRDFR
jgi:hypothetical protein